MHDRLVIDLLVLIAIAAAGAALFERLRLPSIAAFLLMGALAGPGGLGVIEDPERVRALAELGVVLLLFEIGLELPVERLRRLWRRAVIAGGLQVASTLACVAWIAAALGLPTRSALVVGALVAMSSTALVMRLLSQRGEIDAPQGQIAVGVLIFQDLSIVPFLLAIPILAATGPTPSESVVWALLRAVAALAALAALARFALPRLLHQVALLRSRELFTMVSFLLVIGSAVVAEEIGLTLSVGAFVGGLVLSASPYSHQLFAELAPLRGLLLGVFFTAVGMLFDPAAAREQWLLVAAYTAVAIFLKAGFVVAIVALALRQGLRLGVLTGLALAQTGEFSFVLAVEAGQAGLLDAGLRQVFVAGSIATLVATPFLIEASPRVAAFLARGRGAELDATAAAKGPSDHVVLVGFGLAGQSIARVLRARDIPYAAVEANASAVSEAARRGEPVTYGDATRRAILEHVGTPRARLVVVAISDPVATREVVATAHAIAPEVPILARTRYVQHVDELSAAGASQVVAEELESTLELLARSLMRLGVPEESVLRFATELRDEGYEFLRTPEAILDPWLGEMLEQIATHWVEVPEELDGTPSLAELAIRARSGANVLAVDRGGTTLPNPAPSFALQPGDRLLTLGTPDALAALHALLAAPRGGGDP